MDKYFNYLIEETKGTDRKLRKLFSRTFRLLQKIINKGMYEEGSVVPISPKGLSVVQKRKLLKKVYTQVLTRMGQEDNIKMFMNIIDTVPEEYIDYELKINTDQAGVFVNDLIKGKGQLSGSEIGNLINIIKGVGVQAIVHHATGKEKLDKEAAAFGADAINKNTKEFIDSKLARYSGKNQLPSPEGESKGSLINPTKDKSVMEIKRSLSVALSGGMQDVMRSPIGKFVGQIKGSRVDISKRIPDIAIILKNSKDYKQANALFKSKAIGIEFENQSEFDQLLNSLPHSKKTKETASRNKTDRKREKMYD